VNDVHFPPTLGVCYF